MLYFITLRTTAGKKYLHDVTVDENDVIQQVEWQNDKDDAVLVTEWDVANCPVTIVLLKRKKVNTEGEL